MAGDGIQLEAAATSGAKLATAELAWSGDTEHVQVIGAGLLTGSEGAWTYTLLAGGAGAVGAGVQRMTLASDDPAVAALGTINASGVKQLGTWTVTGTGGTFPVTDSGGSLTVDAPVGTPVHVRLSDGTTAISTLPVSAASLPLPTGAATSAAQATGNTSLSSIDGKITACNTGAVTVSAALPAGTNVIGKVGIDQTTPGTTNKVSIGSDGTVTLLTGSATIGKLAANSSGVLIGQVELAASQTLATVTNLAQLGGQAVTMGSGVRTAGTQRVTIATDDQVSVALAAGTNLAGKVSAGLDTGSVYNGATALTPKFFNVDVAASGDNTLVAAVASKKIRVLSLQLVHAKSATPVGGLIKSSTPTNLYGGTGRFPLDNTGATGPGGLTLPFNPLGWFETEVNTNLVLNLDAAQRVVGTGQYVEV